jgi:hypothetical protein
MARIGNATEPHERGAIGDRVLRRASSLDAEGWVVGCNTSSFIALL